MTLEVTYVTETRHFHWSSVKLAYLNWLETPRTYSHAYVTKFSVGHRAVLSTTIGIELDSAFTTHY
jgi:hypothetical protein